MANPVLNPADYRLDVEKRIAVLPVEQQERYRQRFEALGVLPPRQDSAIREAMQGTAAGLTQMVRGAGVALMDRTGIGALDTAARTYEATHQQNRPYEGYETTDMFSSPAALAYTVGQAAGSSIPSLAANMAGGAIGGLLGGPPGAIAGAKIAGSSATWGTQYGIDVEEYSKKLPDMDYDDVRALAAIAAGGQAILENSFGVEPMLRRGMANLTARMAKEKAPEVAAGMVKAGVWEAWKGLLRGGVKGALLGGAGEGATEPAQLAVDHVALAFGGADREALPKFREYIDNALGGFAGGFVLGGAGGAFEAATKTRVAKGERKDLLKPAQAAEGTKGTAGTEGTGVPPSATPFDGDPEPGPQGMAEDDLPMGPATPAYNPALERAAAQAEAQALPMPSPSAQEATPEAAGQVDESQPGAGPFSASEPDGEPATVLAAADPASWDVRSALEPQDQDDTTDLGEWAGVLHDEGTGYVSELQQDPKTNRYHAVTYEGGGQGNVKRRIPVPLQPGDLRQERDQDGSPTTMHYLTPSGLERIRAYQAGNDVKKWKAAGQDEASQTDVEQSAVDAPAGETAAPVAAPAAEMEQDLPEFSGYVEILPGQARSRWKTGQVVKYAGHGEYLVKYYDRKRIAGDSKSLSAQGSGIQRNWFQEYVSADRIRYVASKATKAKYQAEIAAEPEQSRKGIRPAALEFDRLVKGHPELYDWRVEGEATGESKKRDAMAEYRGLKRAREAAADALDIDGDIHSPVVRSRHLEALKLWIAGPGKTAETAERTEGKKDRVQGKEPGAIWGKDLREGDQVQVGDQWLIAEVDDERGVVVLHDGTKITLEGENRIEVAGGEIVSRSGQVRTPQDADGDTSFDHAPEPAAATPEPKRAAPEPRQGKLFQAPGLGLPGSPDGLQQGWRVKPKATPTPVVEPTETTAEPVAPREVEGVSIPENLDPVRFAEGFQAAKDGMTPAAVNPAFGQFPRRSWMAGYRAAQDAGKTKTVTVQVRKTAPDAEDLGPVQPVPQWYKDVSTGTRDKVTFTKEVGGENVLYVRHPRTKEVTLVERFAGKAQHAMARKRSLIEWGEVKKAEAAAAPAESPELIGPTRYAAERLAEVSARNNAEYQRSAEAGQPLATDTQRRAEYEALEKPIRAEHRALVDAAVAAHKPIAADAVRGHKMDVHQGYALEGDRYVFKGDAETTAKDGLRLIFARDASAPESVSFGPLDQRIADAIESAGGKVPVGTPQEANSTKVVHSMDSHPDLSEADILGMPETVNNPTWVGYSQKQSGFKRVWFLRQNGSDTLYIAVYGKREGRLLLHGYFKESKDVIFRQMKEKGVLWEAVANSAAPSAVGTADNPVGQTGLVESRGAPEADVTAPPAEVKPSEAATVYGSNPTADLAALNTLRSRLMASSDRNELEKIKAEARRLKEAWPDSPGSEWSDYFPQWLERKAKQTSKDAAPTLALAGQTAADLGQADTGQATVRNTYEAQLRGIVDTPQAWPEWAISSAQKRLQELQSGTVSDYAKAQASLDGMLASVEKQRSRLTANSGVETQGDLFDKRPQNLFDAAAQEKAKVAKTAAPWDMTYEQVRAELERLETGTAQEWQASPVVRELYPDAPLGRPDYTSLSRRYREMVARHAAAPVAALAANPAAVALKQAAKALGKAADAMANPAPTVETPAPVAVAASTPSAKAEAPVAPAPSRIEVAGDTLATDDQSEAAADAQEQQDAEDIEAQADATEAAGVADFGEKIGGSRKDMARPLGKQSDRGIRPDADVPAWRRAFKVWEQESIPRSWGAMSGPVQRVKTGKWIIAKVHGQQIIKESRQAFDTQAEAEAAVPLFAVSQNHRVYRPSRNGDAGAFGIYRVLSNNRVPLVKGGFATEEDANRYMAEHAVEIITHQFSFPEKPWLDHIERVGGDRRAGANVTPMKFQEVFGFRGGEFGNWNMGSDGQAALNYAYDALLDLADALGIPAKAVSLNGELAIAFGARGYGGKESARAHYEPDKAVINLTKIRGAGSLAHEWWHAVDQYFTKSKKVGESAVYGFPRDTTARPEMVAAFKAIVRAMTANGVTQAVAGDRAGKNLERAQDGLRETVKALGNELAFDHSAYRKGLKKATPEQLKAFAALGQLLIDGKPGEKVFIDGRSKFGGFETYEVIRKMNDLYKSVQRRSFDRADANSRGRRLYWQVKSLQEAEARVAAAGEGQTEEVTLATDFLKESKRIDAFRASDYWSLPHEMGARAFESFIYDTLREKRQQSDYLVHGVENKFYAAFDMKPYPEGAERLRINDAFAAMFKTVEVSGEKAAMYRAAPKGQEATITTSTADARALWTRMFGSDEDLRDVSRLFTKDGLQALGKWTGAWAEIASGQASPSDTAMHEAVHKALDLFMSAEDRTRLVQAAGGEEVLAEKIITYARDGKGFVGRAQRIVERLVRVLRRYFGTATAQDKVRGFYDQLLGGQFANRDGQGLAGKPAAAYRKADGDLHPDYGDTDAERLQKRERLQDMAPVHANTSAFGQERDPDALRIMGKAEYDKLIGQRINNLDDGRTITFSRDQFGKPKSHSADPRIMRLIPSLPSLLRDAVHLYKKPDRDPLTHQNIEWWHTYGVKAAVDGQEVYVTLTTYEQKDGTQFISLYHDHNVTTDEVMKKGASAKPDPVTNRGVSQRALLRNTLYQWWHSVKSDEPGQQEPRYRPAAQSGATAQDEAPAPAKTDDDASLYQRILDKIAGGPLRDRNAKTDLSQWRRWLTTISHYAVKVPGLKRLYDAAMAFDEDKHRYGEMLFGTNEGLLREVRQWIKANRESYTKKVNPYLWGQDKAARGPWVKQNGQGWEVYDPTGKLVEVAPNEDAAWIAAHAWEQRDLLAQGWTAEEAQVVANFRAMNDAQYSMLLGRARELREAFEKIGAPLPQVALQDGQEIDLFSALNEMGSRRGYYMPRIRPPGRWHLLATKDGENPRREHFVTQIGRALRSRKLRAEGWKVDAKESLQPSEEVYLDASPQALQDFVNNALGRMDAGSAATRLSSFDLAVTTETYTKVDGTTEPHLVVTSRRPFGKAFREIAKVNGGYPDKAASTWRFANPSPDLEEKLARGLWTILGGVEEQPLQKFAEHLAGTLAGIIHSRGSRARKIGRSEAVDEQVWEGYETDAERAVVLAGRATAGGTAKADMARRMMKAITGTTESWAEFQVRTADEYQDRQDQWLAYQKQVDHERIDSARQPVAYGDAISYSRHMLANESNTERMVGTVRGVAAVWQMSGPASAVINLTSLATSVPAAMKGYANIPAFRIPLAMAKAIPDYARWVRAANAGTATDVPDAAALQEMHSQGWDTALMQREALEAMSNRPGRAWTQVANWALLPFAVTERLNRGAALLATYREAVRAGNTHEEAMRLAKLVSDKAHGVYGKANLPALARGGTAPAALGRSWFMYKTYTLNYLTILGELGFKDKTAALWLILAPAILGGAAAAPFKDLFLKMIAETLGRAAGEPPPDDPEEWFYAQAQELFGDGGESLARTGLGGTVGLDIRGSLEMRLGEWLPGSVEDLLGAPAGLGRNVIDAAKLISRGAPLRAAEKLAPRLVAGPIRATRESAQGVTNFGGAPVFYGNDPLTPTAGETARRAIGFSPVRISDSMRRQYGEKQRSRKYEDRRGDIYARYRAMRRDGTQGDKWPGIQADIDAYNRDVEASGIPGVSKITKETLKGIATTLRRPPARERARARMMAAE